MANYSISIDLLLPPLASIIVIAEGYTPTCVGYLRRINR